jgi:hypothetical protein
MGKFVKAKSEQAFLKLALYGKPGSGKTLTSLLWGEGLAARENKRIGMIDTERGSEFYGLAIPERRVHPKAFDFDRLITRSLSAATEPGLSVMFDDQATSRQGLDGNNSDGTIEGRRYSDRDFATI